jgi:hypothetical protein
MRLVGKETHKRNPSENVDEVVQEVSKQRGPPENADEFGQEGTQTIGDQTTKNLLRMSMTLVRRDPNKREAKTPTKNDNEDG